MSAQKEIKEIANAKPNSSLHHFAEHQIRPRLLLIEDDKALRRFLQVTLDQAGYDVIPAADGLEGMKMALAAKIDVVVTDAMMPHLSGHEFCRFLRNSEGLSHIPIIILSGSEPQQGLTKKELADAFLAKPVTAAELTDCLERLLRAAK